MTLIEAQTLLAALTAKICLEEQLNDKLREIKLLEDQLACARGRIRHLEARLRDVVPEERNRASAAS